MAVCDRASSSVGRRATTDMMRGRLPSAAGSPNQRPANMTWPWIIPCTGCGTVMTAQPETRQ